MAQHAGISSRRVTATYLYCIVKAPRKPSMMKAPKGVPGAAHPEALQVSGSLWLVVAEVPLDIYGPGPLESHLANMDWVGRTALAHEELVEHFARRPGTTVIPMKLFTMFSTPARATSEIRARMHTIEASLRKIAGAEEWGIRVVRSDRPAAVSRVDDRASSGAAFLAGKKRARDDARNAKLAAARAAEQAYERLAKLSKDARRRDDAASAAGPQPLLDAAFLVAAGKRATFTQTARQEAAACARAGARMTLSGPWPAYNFVESEGRSR